MRIAITGSSGLIGSALVRSLLADGHEVVRLVRRPPSGADEALWDLVLGVNLRGVLAVTHAVLPGMLERKHGNVLFIASMASLFGIPKVVAYSAAKSAFVGMVRTLAAEVSVDNVRVNAIAPGWIDSAMMLRAELPVHRNRTL